MNFMINTYMLNGWLYIVAPKTQNRCEYDKFLSLVSHLKGKLQRKLVYIHSNQRGYIYNTDETTLRIMIKEFFSQTEMFE